MSTDHENEVKVRWHMPGWHIHSDVWTKHGEPRLYGSGGSDPIMKTWCKFNKVSGQWKWGQGLNYENLLYSDLHRFSVVTH